MISYNQLINNMYIHKSICADPIIRGRVSAAFGRQTKVVRENALPGDRMYNVEVLVVIDYGLYER